VRIAALLLLLSGCSFVAVRHPARPDCTRLPIAPIVDTVIALPAAGLGGLLLAEALEDPPSGLYSELDYVVITALLTSATAYLLSAAYGYTRVARCRAR
jgi:hypothetical protein